MAALTISIQVSHPTWGCIPLGWLIAPARLMEYPPIYMILLYIIMIYYKSYYTFIDLFTILYIPYIYTLNGTWLIYEFWFLRFLRRSGGHVHHQGSDCRWDRAAQKGGMCCIPIIDMNDASINISIYTYIYIYI